MGHEYCGFVEEVGSAVKSVKPGQFVVGSFATSDNTCPHCQDRAAMSQKAGRITAAGITKELTFELVDGAIQGRIDEAYRGKYKGSPT